MELTIFQSERVLEWGSLDVPLLGLARDWRGAEVEPPAAFSLVEDPRRLWFVAHRAAPAGLHPQSRPGRFLAELWRHDVAELFLGHADGGRYLELNLAPNGAWWSCGFQAPREREDERDIPVPETLTHAELAADGSWVAAMSLPLDLLRARLDYGPSSRGNVAFILDSPGQRFLSAAPPCPGEPDFHHPDHFLPLRFAPLPPG